MGWIGLIIVSDTLRKLSFGFGLFLELRSIGTSCGSSRWAHRELLLLFSAPMVDMKDNMTSKEWRRNGPVLIIFPPSSTGIYLIGLT